MFIIFLKDLYCIPNLVNCNLEILFIIKCMNVCFFKTLKVFYTVVISVDIL